MFSRLNKNIAYRNLLSNVFSLGILQIANYVLPLISVPYLVRVLGPEYFGLLAFATASVMYFVIITDYGFNLSATRQISLFREDLNKVKGIYSSVMQVKLILCVFSALVVIFVTVFFERFSVHKELYYVSFLMVIGHVLFPTWLFQGMEKMKYISFINIGSKVFFTACIFVFVHEKSDYLVAQTLFSLGFLVSGIISVFYTKRVFGFHFELQSYKCVVKQIQEGWHVFLSTLSISLYTISVTFILGFFASNNVIGYFSAADKLIQALKGLYAPVAQAVYPLVAKKINDDKTLGLVFVRYLSVIVGAFMFAVSLLCFLYAERIVLVMLGKEFYDAVILLKIMAFLPFIIALSNIFGIQTMLNFGKKKEFTLIIVSAAILGLSFCFLLIPRFGAVGAAISMLVTELFVTVVMYLFVRTKLRF